MEEAAKRGSGGLLIIFAGQSNMVGHVRAIDGEKPENGSVFAWSNKGAAGEWRVAELGQAPFNEKPGKPNNPALHFANLLQSESGQDVYLIGLPVNGSTLLSWASPSAANMANLLDEVAAATNSDRFKRTGIAFADSFLWAQGESDDVGATMVTDPKVATLPAYSAAFASMFTCLAAQPWWDAGSTKLIASELVEDGWLAARNDFYRTPTQWPSGCIMGVTSSEGLGHVGDRAHYSGEALQEMGRRMFLKRRLLTS